MVPIAVQGSEPEVVLNLKPMRAAETPEQFIPLNGYIDFAIMPTATAMQTNAKAPLR